VIQHLRWFRRENAGGAEIFVRPSGANALTLIDDLDRKRIDDMRRNGFEPALIVETSPGNFQVWLNHGLVIQDPSLSSLAAKELARRFCGDPSSAGWLHFGRLAGFTNQKLKRRLATGWPPFVVLREKSGRSYSNAASFLKYLEDTSSKLRRQPRRQTNSEFALGTPRKTLTDFHRDPRYGGDLHRADMAWALHAAASGLSRETIESEILNARDLSKKGGSSRQLNYAARTAIKAIAALNLPPHKIAVVGVTENRQ
jgi:hypothetical protein